LGVISCTTPQVAEDAGSNAVRRVGNLLVSGVPEIPADLHQRIQPYRNTRSARLLDWLDDGLLVTTRFGDSPQLHRVRVAGGARQQLTFFSEPVRVAYVPPRGRDRGFIYSRDVGGSEFYQLFWFDLASGESRLLSDGKSRYTEVRWANAGDRFAYTTTQRDGVHWDIHVHNLSGEIVEVLETEAGAWIALDWHPDDGKLLVTRYVSVVESYLFELDLESGTLTPLLDQEMQIAIGDARYAPDGRGIYFVSDLGAEFMRLHRLDLQTGKVDVLTSETPWDIEELVVSPDGERLAYTVNQEGMSQVTVVSLPSHAPLALPAIPKGVVFGLRFAPDSQKLGFVVDGPQTPADVFSVDLARRELSRWTHSEVGGLDAEAFVSPQLIRYRAFDGRQIPAFVYTPPGPGPHPVLVAIHGGPAAQYRPRFSPSIQHYVNAMGIAVIAPNVRGSAGYGKSYLKLDDGYLREDSVRDIGALLDWIERQSDLDASRVAVSGGSYGGYMVLAALVHYSDRLVAGLERVGISNFVTFLTNTQSYRQDLRRVEYGDERVPEMREFLETIAPLNQVDKIRKPLMVSQGQNDPRVPPSESEQIVAALRASEVPVWYVLALDEGHGFSKKPNADYNATASALFLQQFLLR
jgi:dipeptidyl aminopeptidase/acylaminoacyl peptidase